MLLYFNPRSPHGERQLLSAAFYLSALFQSTLPARGATSFQRRISSRQRYFNPRSPHGERLIRERKRVVPKEFQSTLPARGATIFLTQFPQRSADFNPRSPHGERPRIADRSAVHQYFNPRSPHGERRFPFTIITGARDFNPRSPHGERQDLQCYWCSIATFQSTLPARGATTRKEFMLRSIAISIHAPRTGSDNFESVLFVQM